MLIEEVLNEIATNQRNIHSENYDDSTVITQSVLEPGVLRFDFIM